MRSFILMILLIESMPAMAAEGSVVHQISAESMARPPGYPVSPAPLLAIGGKPLQIVLLSPSASENTPVRIDRITAASRAPIANITGTTNKMGWTCDWTPPITRGPVTYEIQFVAKKDLVTRIEVRDPDWVKKQTAMLEKMKWQAAGLNPQEMNALAALGLRRIEITSRDTNTAPFLRMTANDATQYRRQVTWDDKHHDQIVLRHGVAAQDLDVLAPRWWISPEALASDQGLIRFLDLFTEPPHAP